MAKNVECIRYASRLGYQITEDGLILSPAGKQRPGQMHRGYYVLSFFYGPERRVRNISVSKLAGYQWFGEAALQPGIEVRHLDGNSANNARMNLAIGNHSANMLDIAPAIRRARARVAAAAQKRLTDAQAETLREDRKKGATYKELCAKYNIAKSTVSYIVRGITYAAD